LNLNLVKSMVRKTWRGILFIIFLSVMLICTVLFITFLADPVGMYEYIKMVFGISR